MIQDIFDCIACCSCGLCCSKQTLCDKCELHTLRGNGLPVELAPQIHGLSQIWPGNRGFKYSDLYEKLKELIDEQRTKHEKSSSRQASLTKSS